MTDRPDDAAAIVARLAAQSRARQDYDFRTKEFWPDSFIARIRECERLAGKTVYPGMAAMMHSSQGYGATWPVLCPLIPRRTIARNCTSSAPMHIRQIENDEDYAAALADIGRFWNTEPGTPEHDTLTVLCTS